MTNLITTTKALNLIIAFVQKEGSAQSELLNEFKGCGMLRIPTVNEIKAFKDALTLDINASEVLTKADKTRAKGNILKKVYYSALTYALCCKEYQQLTEQLDKLSVADLYKFYLANVANPKGLADNALVGSIELLPNGELKLIKAVGVDVPVAGNAIPRAEDGAVDSSKILLMQAQQAAKSSLLEKLEELQHLRKASDIHAKIQSWIEELQQSTQQAIPF